MNRRVFALLGLAAALAFTPEAKAAEGKDKFAGMPVQVSGFLNGIPATGTFTIKNFAVVGQEVRAIGVVSVSNGAKSVVAAASMPLILPNSSLKTSSLGAAPAGATCEILSLTLGPLDLNLLGLRVQLNQVQLDITAESGPGNLLGNLLCAVANLLNGVNLAGLLQQLVDALNNLINAL